MTGLLLTACGGGGNGTGVALQPDNGVQLESMHQGRLVDVYGFRLINGVKVIELYQADVLTGLDIKDERGASGDKTDEEITYDFLNANPDTLQPRLLITRMIGSEDFLAAYDRLDEQVRRIAPSQFGRDTTRSAYTVVPRNAAIRLTFSGNLGIDDSFFYEKDELGRIVSFKNTGAVQLLKIIGDPNDTDYGNDFEEIHARIAVRDNLLIIDPVLLGSEGLTFGARNSAAGLPAAPDQSGANIRVAVALEGPLRIKGVKADTTGSLAGRNNAAFNSIIRDFRSGNSQDNSAHIARGFVRDPEPPRVIGEMRMFLERVEPIDEETRLLTIYKGDIAHELDRSDVIRLFPDSSGVPAATVEILQEPQDDLGVPEEQHVRVLVRAVYGPNGEDVLEAIDPANLPGFPSAGPQRDAFLVQNAPKAVVIAEYTHRRLHPIPNNPEPFYGDDPRNFIAFNPTPLPDETTGILVANERVSPFAGAVVRFSKPIDMSTLIALDTVFFATRNLLDQAAVAKFISDRNIDPATFNEAKFRTPHLIHSRIFDEDGSQTAVRVQPSMGFYLDEAMRVAYEQDAGKPFAERRYHYHLHLVGGLNGVRDLSGNPLDFQAQNIVGQPAVESVVMPFEIDAGRKANGQPVHEDNLAIYIVRRFADEDEDERPSIYRDDEIKLPGQDRPAEAFPSKDFFGPVSYLENGTLVARPGARVRRVVDNLNQVGAPPQTDWVLRWCPLTGYTAFGSPNQIIFQTAATVFGQPIQNPLNPFGCRLQAVWREIDMSLSRTDPSDFNLDVEQMYWAPFAAGAIVFDEFDRGSLFLGHSEMRPEPCIASGDAFPSMPNSGLRAPFADNYANNRNPDNSIEDQPAPHPAYVDKQITISAKDAITEVNGVNRYLPLPAFEDATKISGAKSSRFVWRDEQVYVQGGNNGVAASVMSPYPYLLGPFLAGRGQAVVDFTAGNDVLTLYQPGRWYNHRETNLTGSGNDTKTQGLVGSIGLPLLADFWIYPDSAGLPTYDPFLASGANGWQVSLAATSSPRPDFRAYSAGRGEVNGSPPVPIDPTHPNWARASGGYTPGGGGTAGRDNTVYWVMADFVKRTAVVTSGFVEIANPHRMESLVDPRLGPYNVQNKLPNFVYDFEPSLASLPNGTKVVPEFRGASALSQKSSVWPQTTSVTQPDPRNPGGPQITYSNPLTEDNFPNDPLKAGDAHIRHFDNRVINGKRRDHWVYMYNRVITRYTEEPNDLAREGFTNQFSGPNENFTAQDVKYFNWRFVMQNNVDSNPPVSPVLESFSVSYRLLGN